MRSSLKNTKAVRLLVRPFEHVRDVALIVIDRITWGLFGGLFMLTISAQAQELDPYKLLLKGERSPYDSAVAIELPTYRFETQKLQLGDQLIDSLLVEIDSLREEARLSEVVISSQERVIETQGKTISRTDSTLNRIDANYDKLHEIATAPEPLLDRVPSWLVAVIGLVIGLLIAQ